MWHAAASGVACLTRAITSAGLEADEFVVDADKDEKGLSNGMGLFLQKTNIIRDYLEARSRRFLTLSGAARVRACMAADTRVSQDIMEEPAPRMFWPKVVWSKCERRSMCLRL